MFQICAVFTLYMFFGKVSSQKVFFRSDTFKKLQSFLYKIMGKHTSSHLARHSKTAKSSLKSSGFFSKMKEWGAKGHKMAQQLAKSNLLSDKQKRWLDKGLDVLDIGKRVLADDLSQNRSGSQNDGELKAFGFLLPAVAGLVGRKLFSSGTFGDQENLRVVSDFMDENLSDTDSDDDAASDVISDQKQYFTNMSCGDEPFPVFARVYAADIESRNGKLFLKGTEKPVLATF